MGLAAFNKARRKESEAETIVPTAPVEAPNAAEPTQTQVETEPTATPEPEAEKPAKKGK